VAGTRFGYRPTASMGAVRRGRLAIPGYRSLTRARYRVAASNRCVGRIAGTIGLPRSSGEIRVAGDGIRDRPGACQRLIRESERGWFVRRTRVRLVAGVT